MARVSRIRRAYLKQKRSGVAELRLRDMNNEAHNRASGIGKSSILKTYQQVYGLPDDITVDTDRVCRLLQGLGEGKEVTTREQILRRVQTLRDRAELVFVLDTRRMFLIQEDDGSFYFLYRDKGSYYKKSISYPSRTRAMDRYDNERITWLFIQSETKHD